MPKTKTKTLECPKCGASAADECEFKYVEDIQNWRQVRGIENGELIIESHYETGEGYDDGDNPRLMCAECCFEFPLPADLGIEFI